MTQAVSSVRTYDDFTSLGLDMSRWRFLEYTDGSGGKRRCQEPNARTDVGESTLDMHVEQFERAHDRIQLLDNLKHHLMSTDSIRAPARGRVTFSLEMAVTNINATPDDYRDGFASFTLLNFSTGWAFSTCMASQRIFGLYENRLEARSRPQADVVEPPSRGVRPRPGISHLHEVTLDTSRQRVEWRVDRHLLLDALDTKIPSRLNIGLGLMTLHPIDNGRSRSVRGQGLSASFGPVAIRYAR